MIKEIINTKNIEIAKAIRALEDEFGFDNLYNLRGGITTIEKDTDILSKLSHAV